MLRTFHRWGGLVFIAYVSQLDGNKDYFPFDGIFPAFIGIGSNKGY